MLADYKEGMVVQAGSAVANIASEQDEYKIQAYVDANSIAQYICRRQGQYCSFRPGTDWYTEQLPTSSQDG